MKQLKDASNSRSNTVDTPTDSALLRLFQIHDSAFPIGSYTQSYGMETYIQEDLIRTKEDLIDYCTSFLFHNLVRGDAILIQEAYAAAKERDVGRLLEFRAIMRGHEACKGIARCQCKPRQAVHPNGFTAWHR